MSLHIDVSYIGLLYAGACNFWKNSCSTPWGLFSTISLIL